MTIEDRVSELETEWDELVEANHEQIADFSERAVPELFTIIYELMNPKPETKTEGNSDREYVREKLIEYLNYEENGRLVVRDHEKVYWYPDKGYFYAHMDAPDYMIKGTFIGDAGKLREELRMEIK